MLHNLYGTIKKKHKLSWTNETKLRRMAAAIDHWAFWWGTQAESQETGHKHWSPVTEWRPVQCEVVRPQHNYARHSFSVVILILNLTLLFFVLLRKRLTQALANIQHNSSNSAKRNVTYSEVCRNVWTCCWNKTVLFATGHSCVQRLCRLCVCVCVRVHVRAQWKRWKGITIL
jgi:hypothetical protein